MKRILLLIVLTCFPLPSLANDNVGGILVAHDVNLTIAATGGLPDGQTGSVLNNCSQLDTEVEVEGPDAWAVFRLYLIFPETSSMCLGGVTWGIRYDPKKLVIADYHKCGDFDFADTGWPQTGTGNSVTWDVPQTAHVVPVCTFAAYTAGPSGGTPCVFELGPNLYNGGLVGESCTPYTDLQPIVDFGKLGFHMPGYGPCSAVPVERMSWGRVKSRYR